METLRSPSCYRTATLLKQFLATIQPFVGYSLRPGDDDQKRLNGLPRNSSTAPLRQRSYCKKLFKATASASEVVAAPYKVPAFWVNSESSSQGGFTCSLAGTSSLSQSVTESSSETIHPSRFVIPMAVYNILRKLYYIEKEEEGVSKWSVCTNFFRAGVDKRAAAHSLGQSNPPNMQLIK